MAADFETDILIVGAGVVGLAVAARLAESHSVLVVEKYGKFGQETSSRNSEVVHSGIYYPRDSKKTALCIEGRKRLYAFCEAEQVPYRKCGKFVVGTSDTDAAYLETLRTHAEALSVPVVPLSESRLRQDEPWVKAVAALEFPETGIVDSHAMMAALERKALARGATLLYRNRVILDGDGAIAVTGPEGTFSVAATQVVNAAGNGAGELAQQQGLHGWSQKFCRGRYLFLSSRWRGRFARLIYPTPEKDGLGVHVTLDMDGRVRLGPDVAWVEETVRYDDLPPTLEPDWETLISPFWRAVQRYCPALERSDLQPGYVGVRPKLFRGESAHRDFVWERHGAWMHLLGVESPGLTAALALAEAVAKEISC